MNRITNDREKNDSKISEKHFEKIVKISLIIGIIIVSGFIIYYLLTPEPGYITFGILNDNQEAENYPTEAPINETISFYLKVENHLDKDLNFGFKIKKGNNDTIMSSSGSNGTLYLTLGNFTLNPNEGQIYGEYNITFSEAGENKIIIAELWTIENGIEAFFNIMFMRLNITY
jgi:uncharacterized membrane protein